MFQKVGKIVILAMCLLTVGWMTSCFLLIHRKDKFISSVWKYPKLGMTLYLHNDKLWKVELEHWDSSSNSTPRTTIGKNDAIPLVGACGVQFGAGEKEIVKVWGKPRFCSRDDWGNPITMEYIFKEGEITFQLNDGELKQITIVGVSFPIRLSKTLHMGANSKEIRSKYGEPEKTETKITDETVQRYIDVVPSSLRYLVQSLIETFWAVFFSAGLFLPLLRRRRFPFFLVLAIVFTLIYGAIKLLLSFVDLSSRKFLVYAYAGEYSLFDVLRESSHLTFAFLVPLIMYQLPLIFLIGLVLFATYPYERKRDLILAGLAGISLFVMSHYVYYASLLPLAFASAVKEFIGIFTGSVNFYEPSGAVLETGILKGLLTYGWLVFFQRRV